MVESGEAPAYSPGALAGVRVVDFSWVRAGPWATRWLGSLGAQVIKVEWPETERGRTGGAMTPQGIEVSLNSSGSFNDTNANKLSITLNVRTDLGMELIRRLISISDIVLENFSSRVMRNWGLGYEELRKLRPDIVYVSMSGFGHTGRDHNHTTFGPSAQALSGMTYLSGLPGAPPAGWGWSYLDDTGGLYAAMCALTGLYHRNATGRGQHVDLSQMITGVTLNGPVLLDLTVNGRSAVRDGYPPGNRAHWPGTPRVNNYRGPTAAPHNTYRTSPGGYNDWCVIVCLSDLEWRQLVHVMGSPSWATSPKFDTLDGRLLHQEELDRGIEAWTRTLEKYQVTERCQNAGVRAMPVQSSEDRMEHDPQLRHRGMYQEVEHPVLGIRKMQKAPFKLSDTPAEIYSASPLIGQDNWEVFLDLLGLSREELQAGYEDGIFWPKTMERYSYLEEFPRSSPGRLAPRATTAVNAATPNGRPSNRPPGRDGPAEGPLTGLRVLELADEKGQFCGKLMADLGADVIKIEPPGGEANRRTGPFLDDIPHTERSLAFWHYNTSKRGITLDLETADGQAIFRRLAARADVILETRAPGYLDSLALGYPDLVKENPRLLMCSLTPFGQTGPWRDYATSDLLHLAAGGQMASCGYDEDDVSGAPPIAPGGGQAWHTGCHYAYIAVLAGLVHRMATGRGQYIDASVHDACALTTEGAVPTYIYTGQVVIRQTGRHHAATPTPQCQFRAQDGRYVNSLIANRLNPRFLKELAEFMASYGLAEDLLDPRYQDPAVIQENVLHIMEVSSRFLARIPQQVAYREGQKRGFPWGAVRTPDELLGDGHLEDRGVWIPVEHPELGRTFTYAGGAAIYNGTPWRLARRAPLIGEHNQEVYGEELGITPLELTRLAENGVV